MQFGRMDEYKESKEDFESHIKRLEQWLLANDTASEKKVSVFLSVIGAETYGLLKNLVTQTKREHIEEHAGNCKKCMDMQLDTGTRGVADVRTVIQGVLVALTIKQNQHAANYIFRGKTSPAGPELAGENSVR
ncbi:hypothetical protein QQF64_024000 [Cirrhinus molitorella]|uniref:Uncharacterized protein n=1 Tax=Cirrhinus molitorella TaxID=172907 RepID=A0ABR3NKG1_9TELE